MKIFTIVEKPILLSKLQAGEYFVFSNSKTCVTCGKCGKIHKCQMVEPDYNLTLNIASFILHSCDRAYQWKETRNLFVHQVIFHLGASFLIY